MSRIVIAGTAMTATALLIRAAAQAATFLVLARYFAPEVYGQFVALVCVGVLLAPMVTAGTEYVIVSLVATRRATTSECIGSGLMVLSVLAPLGVCVAVGYTAMTLKLMMPWGAVVQLLIAEIVFVPVLELSWRAYQANERMSIVGVLRACPALLKLVAACFLVLGVYRADIAAWATAYLLASMLAAMASLGAAAYHFGMATAGLTGSWRAVREGWPFAVYSLAERTTNDVDKLLLATLSGTGAAGLYSAAYRLIEVLIMPMMAVLMTVNAAIYRIGAATPRVMLFRLGNIGLLIGAYGVAVAVAVVFGADRIVSILGKGYADSAEALRALAILPLCYGLRVLLGFGLAGTGKQFSRMLVQGAAALLSALLCLLLIPRYGAIGAAMATISTEIVSIGVLATLLARIRHGAKPVE